MEVKEYCTNIGKELAQWQGKLHHIINQLDSMPTNTKQAVYEEVNGLHILMTEMDDRIERIRSECSIAWEPESEEPTPTVAGSSQRFNDNANIHFDYDFGG